jgi:hypothetical protein
MYLDVAMYLGLLAVQAFSRPGSDIRGQSFPYVPEGDEVAGCLHSHVGGPVSVVKYLPAEVPVYQRSEQTCGSVANEA